MSAATRQTCKERICCRSAGGQEFGFVSDEELEQERVKLLAELEQLENRGKYSGEK